MLLHKQQGRWAASRRAHGRGEARLDALRGRGLVADVLQDTRQRVAAILVVHIEALEVLPRAERAGESNNPKQTSAARREVSSVHVPGFRRSAEEQSRRRLHACKPQKAADDTKRQQMTPIRVPHAGLVACMVGPDVVSSRCAKSGSGLPKQSAWQGPPPTGGRTAAGRRARRGAWPRRRQSGTRRRTASP